MPVSNEWGKEWVRERILSIFASRKIGTVVDVGCGVGTYSDLLRKDLPARWIGVEVWAPYIDDYDLEGKYDVVYPDDIRLIPDVLTGTPDLVIMGDVLEHMPKSDAQDLVYSYVRCPTVLAICIPVLHLDQGAVYGNPYEIHTQENHWHSVEMKSFLELKLKQGYTRLDTHVGDVVAYFVLS